MLKNISLSPAPFDLFGDVVVTLDDCELWLDCVPRMQGCTAKRRAYYFKYWDVVNKIKRAKIEGYFSELTASAPEEESRLSAVLLASRFKA